MDWRIPKNTEQVFAAYIGGFTAQVIKVGEEVKHEIFVDDVAPVFRFNIRKNSLAKSRIERNNLV
jgi:hypothetical protein